MKKTVSWSTETLKAAAKNKDDSSSSPSNMTKSSSVCAAASSSSSSKDEKQPQLTSPAVNSRIQQMIAMQKAQNATMRQLMSTGYGGLGSASPSGLRDMVTVKSSPAPKSLTGVAAKGTKSNATGSSDCVGKTNTLTGVSTVQPIKPPAPTKPVESELTSTATRNNGNGSGGIHYQVQQKTNTFRTVSDNTSVGLLPGAPPTNPYNNLGSTAIAASKKSTLMSTPPHLHPQLPNFGSREDNDSPISYNSVLDQNSTPNVVKERKRMEHQLHTIQSQEQMMQAQYSEDKNDVPVMTIPQASSGDNHQPLRIEQNVPQQVPEAVNWENMGVTHQYPLKPIVQQYGYGATDVTANRNANRVEEKPTSATQAQSGTERQRLMSSLNNSPIEMQDDVLPPMSHTQHQFHYGGGGNELPASVRVQHSNYNDYGGYHGHGNGRDQHTYISPFPQHNFQSRGRRRRRNIWWAILCYPFQCLFTSEHLGRSFCFGAIDGMLTGAGILAACVGLGILSHFNDVNVSDSASAYETYMRTKWMLIALTLAACFSDGICMAIGHVWSTRLVAGTAYEERKEELRNFETNRSDAKARLVDALLMKGMLKIDAMSLADTLEGYPDMFVSALLGEGLCGNGNTTSGMSGFGSGGGGGSGMIRVPSGGGGVINASQRHQHTMGNDWNIPPSSYAPREMHHGGIKYESYSDFSDFHQDPDLRTYTESLYDSRIEGFFMMLSFGSFSTIPILIYTFIPMLINWIVIPSGKEFTHDRPPRDSMSIIVSLAISTAVMFLLGCWKSRFYSSNWCLFGLETVGVLLLCIASAYYVGLVCGSLINSHFT